MTLNGPLLNEHNLCISKGFPSPEISVTSCVIGAALV